MLKRIIYLGYYFKELDRKKFFKFYNYVLSNYNFSKRKLLMDIVKSSLKYNISILDYFYFKFYELDEKSRNKFAGTGYMYEYQLGMNPKNKRDILEDKFLFYKNYNQFIKHEMFYKDKILADSVKSDNLFSKSGKIVLKSSDGQCGEGIEVLNLNEIDKQNFIEKLANSNNDLLEEFIIQHDDLMNLSPSGLNTVRIFTQLNTKDEVDILGARLRITINSFVDNFAAGNIAAPIDVETGKINGRAVYSDITKKDEENHPITNVKINGFQVPFWAESMQMVKDAALLHPENRSIGWDVAITNNGPELLEGNHNWCKLLWQLPVKQGLKEKLETYI